MGSTLQRLRTGPGGQRAQGRGLNYARGPAAALLAGLALALLSTSPTRAASELRFEVSLRPGVVSTPQTGRLLVALSRTEKQPRTIIGQTGLDAPVVLGRDADDWQSGKPLALGQTAAIFPIASLSDLPAGDYFVQAVLARNNDLRSPGAEGNLFSEPQRVQLDPAHAQTVALELTSEIPPEQLPADTEFVKFVKIRSELLSAFHKRPIYLRAGIVLPRDYAKDTALEYPLWVRIGGLDTRYTLVLGSMEANSGFRKIWLAPDTPQMILLQVDGAGPWGDAYQVNSANNGPYGDAITRELIPFVEAKFRAIGQPKARVLSGVSTGGWVSLALQVFYPDFFNGVWSSCPDGVDFRAFELVNIYSDENAYVNRYGYERPSEREVTGEIKLTMRREVQLENVLGHGDSWTSSGGQWGAWNATYGPRGADGRPVPLWDPRTGRIDHAVAAQWERYDLRLVMERNWAELGPKLRGKLHIAVGDADNYFLNNGVRLLEHFLAHAQPAYEGRIAYGPGKGHGWSDVTLAEMLKEMSSATGPAKP